MTTLQATEIIGRIRGSRAQFIERLMNFSLLGEWSSSPQNHYIIDYLLEHEQANFQALDDLLHHPGETMKHFVRFFPIELDHHVQELLIDDQGWNTGDELVARALQVKSCYRDLFASCANHQSLEKTREYFEKLYAMEDMQLHDIGRRLSELEQGI